MESKQFRRGDSIHLKVHASSSTRTLVAHLEGANNRAGDPLLPDLGFREGDAQEGTQIAEAGELDEDTAEIKE